MKWCFLHNYVLLISLMLSVPILGSESHLADVGTFSIVACDSSAGELGVAVHSKSLAVGNAVPYAAPGVGAVATQARSNLGYGPDAIALLEEGIPVAEVVEILTSKDPNRAIRQLGVIDIHGRSACFTGEQCAEWAGHIAAPGLAVQGNILAGEQVVRAMYTKFLGEPGSLANRLLAALEAGQEAGGDRRGQQSAALLVVKDGVQTFIDLRVDDHVMPIAELRRLLVLHEQTSQVDTYLYFGRKYLADGNAGEAESAYASAISIAQKYQDAGNADLLNSVAWELAIADQHLDIALKFAEQAVSHSPGRAEIWDTLAEVHFHLKNYREAVKAQERAVELDPDQSSFQERLEMMKAAESQ